MTDAAHILRASGVAFGYRADQTVLHGVDFTAQTGELRCILGPNGSGKTTLLRCLLGQLTPTAGQIELDGKVLGHHSRGGMARRMAYVPQFPRTAFAFTVREIILMGRYAHSGMLGLASENDLAVGRLAMRMTKTELLADRTLDELSGGEAQRVMIARALAQQPSVLLLDEPTSHLDIKNQLLIYAMMRRLAHDWQMAVVCVSHDVNVAGRFADRVALMRDGRVVADEEPAKVMTRDLLRKTYDVEVDLIAVPDEHVPLIRAREP